MQIKKCLVGFVKKSTREYPRGMEYTRIVTGKLMDAVKIDYLGIPNLDRIVDLLNTVFEIQKLPYHANLKSDNEITVMIGGNEILSIIDYLPTSE